MLAIIIAISLSALSLNPAAATDKSNPYGTSTIDPAGPNDIIFSITKGKVRFTYTTAQLNKLKTSDISLYEPFLKVRQRFSVISMQYFLKKIGASGSDKVFTNALNDYIYENTATKFIQANAFIAVKRNGQAIPYDQGGPIRIVFADNSTWAKNLDAWNWSLSSITVK